MNEYLYLGDRNTRFDLKKKPCKAFRKNGKCIRGKNGSMLVTFEDGKMQVVVGRLLRKIVNTWLLIIHYSLLLSHSRLITLYSFSHSPVCSIRNKSLIQLWMLATKSYLKLAYQHHSLINHTWPKFFRCWYFDCIYGTVFLIHIVWISSHSF